MSSASVHFKHGADALADVLRPDEHSPVPMLVFGTENGASDHRLFVRPEFADLRERMTAEHVQFAWKLADAAFEYATEVATAFERDHVAEFGVLPEEDSACPCWYCTQVRADNVESAGGEASAA